MAIFDDARKLEMYRFFLVAFNAAPGLTYLAQLQQAVESGLSTREIVNIFTTKQQFTSVYPESLSHTEFASRLIQRVIGSSASTPAREQAITDVIDALDAGLSRGDVITQIFGNLAQRQTDPSQEDYDREDPYLGVAKKLANQVVVAKHFTEVLRADSILLSVLQGSVAKVNENSLVNTTEAIENVIR
jgi:hypothetical protein